MVSNAKSVGGFTFFKKGQVSLNDGEFEGIFIRKPKNPQELQAVINSFVTLKPNDQIIGVHSDYFRITSDQEVAYTLDGEMAEATKRWRLSAVTAQSSMYVDRKHDFNFANIWTKNCQSVYYTWHCK